MSFTEKMLLSAYFAIGVALELYIHQEPDRRGWLMRTLLIWGWPGVFATLLAIPDALSNEDQLKRLRGDYDE